MVAKYICTITITCAYVYAWIVQSNTTTTPRLDGLPSPTLHIKAQIQNSIILMLNGNNMSKKAFWIVLTFNATDMIETKPVHVIKPSFPNCCMASCMVHGPWIRRNGTVLVSHCYLASSFCDAIGLACLPELMTDWCLQTNVTWQSLRL